MKYSATILDQGDTGQLDQAEFFQSDDRAEFLDFLAHRACGTGPMTYRRVMSTHTMWVGSWDGPVASPVEFTLRHPSGHAITEAELFQAALVGIREGY